MKPKLIILGLLCLFLCIHIATAEQNIIRAQTNDCVSYSLNYQSLHPEYGLLLIGTNSQFYGNNHLVNYMIQSDHSLFIHDSMFNYSYTVNGWQYNDHYRFLINGEQPQRRFRGLKTSNSMEVYNAL